MVQGRIIDSCALLNLYTGWGGLKELAEFEVSWHVGETVFEESEYVREIDSNGNIINVPLDLRGPVEAKLLSKLVIEGDQEFLDYVDLAIELDDGEAESMAFARNRDLILITDDKKALKVAERLDVSVVTMTTPAIIREWSQLNRINTDRIRQVIDRIRNLARFQPSSNSSDRVWWDSFSGE